MRRKLKFKGTWYPSDNDYLKELTTITPTHENNYLFGVVPHAGLYYSNDLIRLFFNNLDPKVNKIILITPSHYFALDDNVIGCGKFKSFETSFREVSGFTIPSLECGYEQVTKEEHAVEMLLPYIAQIKDVKLCCAHVNKFSDMTVVNECATNILEDIDENTAVIASSDFTHYGNNFGYNPFGTIIDDKVIEKVTTYDRDVANQFISGRTTNTYQKVVNEDKATICGIAPILIVSEMARISNMKGKILGQSNSIKGSTANNNFVSYLTLAWRK